MTCLALVDDAAQREKSETVKQFEDGVTRLVDGEDDQSIVLHTPTARTAKQFVISSAMASTDYKPTVRGASRNLVKVCTASQLQSCQLVDEGTYSCRVCTTETAV